MLKQLNSSNTAILVRCTVCACVGFSLCFEAAQLNAKDFLFVILRPKNQPIESGEESGPGEGPPMDVSDNSTVEQDSGSEVESKAKQIIPTTSEVPKNLRTYYVHCI